MHALLLQEAFVDALQQGRDIAAVGPSAQLQPLYSSLAAVLASATPQQRLHAWQAVVVAPTREVVRQASTPCCAACQLSVSCALSLHGRWPRLRALCSAALPP